MRTPKRAATLAALVIAALLAPASAALASDPSLDVTERWMLGQVNAARADAGAGPLEASATLAGAADDYASYLAAHPSATGHEADGTTVGQRLDAAGWPDAGAYAEDVFTSRTDGAQDALDAWLASPAHRANILDGTLHAVGVARAGRSWVLDFARACPSGAEGRCAMTGDRGDATLPLAGSGSDGGTPSTGTSAPATAPPVAAPGGSEGGAGSTPPGTATPGSSAAGSSGTPATPAAAVPLHVSAVRTRGQVISVTVAVAGERRRAVRVTASRAGRTVALRLASSRALARGRVARTYARRLPAGTWRIHARLRRARSA